MDKNKLHTAQNRQKKKKKKQSGARINIRMRDGQFLWLINGKNNSPKNSNKGMRECLNKKENNFSTAANYKEQLFFFHV